MLSLATKCTGVHPRRGAGVSSGHGGLAPAVRGTPLPAPLGGGLADPPAHRRVLVEPVHLLREFVRSASEVLGGSGSGLAPYLDDLTARPLTARSVTLIPGDTPWSAQCELQMAQPNGSLVTVKRFRFDRSNMKVAVGPMPRGPVVASFPAVTASRFRLVLSRISGQPALAELDLSGAARLESYVEKQLGKMHPTPQPKWDTYLWPAPAEPVTAAEA